MEENKHILDIDIKEPTYINDPEVRQNDDVYFVINITDDGEPYDLSGLATITLAVKRSGGTVVISPGEKTDDNQVTFKLPKSSVSLIGKTEATVQMYDSDNRISTFTFPFRVVKDPSGKGWEPSDGEKTLIQVVLGDGPLVIQRAEQVVIELENAADYIDDKKPLIEKFTSDQTNLQAQVDQLVVDGESSPESAQARVGADATSYATLKARLDAEQNKTTTLLADTGKNFKSTPTIETGTLGQELINATGWVSDGWTGTFANGFKHVAGQTTPLTKDIGATGTKSYVISFTVNSPTSNWHLTVTVGNSQPFEIYKGDHPIIDYVISAKSITDGVLSFNPATAFDGTITKISVKEVVGKRDSTLIIQDSSGNSAIEINNTPSQLDNTFIGKNSGETNMDGYGNNSLGVNALRENVTGFWNNAIGLNALRDNIAGSRNVGIGYNALMSNISGQRNQAIGSWALPRNTTGIKNISIGSDSMFYNTVGSENFAGGFAAMQLNESGSFNIAIGSRSSNNNRTADNNIALGFEALQYNESGAANIAIGRQSMSGRAGENPKHNVVIGYTAGVRMGNGADFNIILGTSAGGENTTGSRSVSIGCRAGMGVVGQSTSNNVLIGYQAGIAINTGANDNVLIGYQAGDSITTGANNIIIGSNQDTPAPTTSNWLNIGGKIFADLTAVKVGVGVPAPKARLHLQSTTSGVPSIIIESGAVPNNPTSDLVGALYYDGTDLYFNNHQGVRRKITMEVA